MVRINLIRNNLSVLEGGVDPEVVKELQKKAITNGAVIVVIPLAVYIYHEMKMSELSGQRDKVQAEANSVNTELKNSNTELQKVKTLSDEAKKLKERLDELRKLARGRTREIRIIDELQIVLPAKTYLNSLEINDQTILLSGASDSREAIGALLRDLEQSPIFTNTLLKNSLEATVEGLPMQTFEVTMELEKGSES